MGFPKLQGAPFLSEAVVYEGTAYQLHDRALVADITRRDRGKCCITSLSNSFWDPLVVAPIFPTKIRVEKVADASFQFTLVLASAN